MLRVTALLFVLSPDGTQKKKIVMEAEIKKVLEAHSSMCLDNQTERALLVEALVTALRKVTRRGATYKEKRGDLSKQFAEWRAADLDECVHELKAAEAAGINNCGEEDQLIYLLTTLLQMDEEDARYAVRGG